MSFHPFVQSSIHNSCKSFCFHKTFSYSHLSLTSSRYDIFILPEFWNVKDSPSEVYNSMALCLSHFDGVKLKDGLWITDPFELKREIEETYNTNCGVPASEVAHFDVFSDWSILLSEEERKNYRGYLEDLLMSDIHPSERHQRVVAVQQDPKHRPMISSPDGILPAFTKDSTKRLMITNLNRWMLAKEKLAISGFPVCQAWDGYGEVTMTCTPTIFYSECLLISKSSKHFIVLPEGNGRSCERTAFEHVLKSGLAQVCGQWYGSAQRGHGDHGCPFFCGAF